MENKLKDLFNNKDELEQIKVEIAKSPILTGEDFLDFYNELKLKEKALENESEQKKLDQ